MVGSRVTSFISTTIQIPLSARFLVLVISMQIFILLFLCFFFFLLNKGSKKYEKSYSVCLTLATPWTVAHQAPLSMEFSSKKTRVDIRSLLQVIFPTQGQNLGFLLCKQILYHLSHEESRSEINLCFLFNSVSLSSISLY